MTTQIEVTKDNQFVQVPVQKGNIAWSKVFTALLALVILSLVVMLFPTLSGSTPSSSRANEAISARYQGLSDFYLAGVAPSPIAGLRLNLPAIKD